LRAPSCGTRERFLQIPNAPENVLVGLSLLDVPLREFVDRFTELSRGRGEFDAGLQIAKPRIEVVEASADLLNGGCRPIYRSSQGAQRRFLSLEARICLHPLGRSGPFADRRPTLPLGDDLDRSDYDYPDEEGGYSRENSSPGPDKRY